MDAYGEQYVRVQVPDKGHIAVHIEVDQLPPISMARKLAWLEQRPPQPISAREEWEGIQFIRKVLRVRRYVETAAKLGGAGQRKNAEQRDEVERKACRLAMHTALFHPLDGERNRAEMQRQVQRYGRGVVIWLLRGNRLLTQVLDEAESKPIH
jgi:hypothetical protein